MYRTRTFSVCCILVSWILAGSPCETRSAADDFAHDIMPILKKHCAECHLGSKKKGGLSINSRADLLKGGETGGVVIPGKSSESRLVELIESTDETERMPPDGPRLSSKDIEVIKKWIDNGLKWPADITLGPSAWEPPLQPRNIQLPPPRGGRNHPIDRILDSYLAEHDRPLPTPLSDAAFLRRATLDAIGLLPDPDELSAFVADPANDKRTKKIDQLLAREIAYADHWLTFWNDLLRNDYTGTGFITGGRKQITGWLYRSLRENKPYDQFVRELISPTPESAGFINGIKWRGNVNASQTREIQFAQNISQVFLGINMKCASCHDSFIDRWTLKEAYNLAAIYSEHPLELNRCDKPTGKTATPKWIFPELGDVDPRAPKAERLKQLAALMTHPKNGRFTRTIVNRIWERLMGRGIVHPVDAMHTQPWNEDLLDYLAVRFASDGYDLKKFIRFVMTSEAYQSRSVILESEPGDDYIYRGPIAKRMTAEQLIDSIWQITGTNPTVAEAKVDRVIRTGPPVAEPDSRLNDLPVLAKWIWHSGKIGRKSSLRKQINLQKKPATARLMATCDNAFSLNINGKQVAASKDWTRPVVMDVTNFFKPGDNLIEVEAEMFGGAAGFIAQIDLLDGDRKRSIFTDKSWQAHPPGRSDWTAAAELKPHGAQPWGALLDPKQKPQAPNGPAPPVRASLVKNDFLMRSLGRPHRDQVVTTRPAELTTLQAIDLSNGEILFGYLVRGAANLAKQFPEADPLIDRLYLFAFSRKPTSHEKEILIEIVGNGTDPQAIEDLLWTIFMQPEFQIIR